MRLPSKMDERGPAREIRRKLNQIIDALVSLRIIRAPNMRVAHTTLGQRIEVEAVSEAVPAPSTGMRWRGEWSASVNDYESGDVVVVRGGNTAGTYIAITSVPTSLPPSDPPVDPANGIYWVSLARNGINVW